MTIDALAAWLMTAMTTWNPPGQHREGEQAATERYTSIAHDVAEVALDSNEQPLFEDDGGGVRARAQTALLLAAVASYESGFRREVDLGTIRGDNGRSWCILQVQVFGRTVEQWTGKDLIEDRRRCVRASLHRMHDSFAACKSLPQVQRLSGYTRGRCGPDPKAEWRMRRALNWWKLHPLALVDTKLGKDTTDGKDAKDGKDGKGATDTKDTVREANKKEL
ncbi:hypothetical protein [Pendulispora albinea]|uniref:Uncharacterized protein n=1 Tax=Pendulispora albinea TaxID=2741071 RepID=A0ABZ2M8L7_9BACT